MSATQSRKGLVMTDTIISNTERSRSVSPCKAPPGTETGFERNQRRGRHATRLARSGRVSAATALWIAGLRGRNDRFLFTAPLREIARRPVSRSMPRRAPRHRAPARRVNGRQRRTGTSRDDGEGGEPGEPPADRPRRDTGRPRSRPTAVERPPRITGGHLVPVGDLLPRVLADLVERARHAALWRRRASRSGGLRPRLTAKSGLAAVTA